MIVAWGVGQLVSDRFLWSQWLLWIPTPAAMVAAILGLLAATRPRSSRRQRRGSIPGWSLLLMALTIDFMFVENRFLHPSRPAAGITVVNWNIHPALGDGREALAAALVELAGDVNIVSNDLGATAEPEVREWAKGLAWGRIYPFTVISRLPIIELRPLVVSREIRVALLVVETADVPGPLSILMFDLPSDPRTPRMAIAKRTVKLLESVNAPKADLLVGDFNTTRGSAALRTIAPAYVNAFDRAGSGYGATFPRRWPLYQIDHVLAAPTVKIDRYERIDAGVGRHLAQRVTLSGRVKTPAPEAAAGHGQ